MATECYLLTQQQADDMIAFGYKLLAVSDTECPPPCVGTIGSSSGSGTSAVRLDWDNIAPDDTLVANGTCPDCGRFVYSSILLTYQGGGVWQTTPELTFSQPVVDWCGIPGVWHFYITVTLSGTTATLTVSSDGPIPVLATYSGDVTGWDIHDPLTTTPVILDLVSSDGSCVWPARTQLQGT